MSINEVVLNTIASLLMVLKEDDGRYKELTKLRQRILNDMAKVKSGEISNG